VGGSTVSSATAPDETVMEALCDDLNTPNVITRLHALAGELRSAGSGPRQGELRQKLKASGVLLGILQQTEEEYQRHHPLRMAADQEKISNLIDARAHARRTRDFKQADAIRLELANMGVDIEDRKDGTTSWKIKRRA